VRRTPPAWEPAVCSGCFGENEDDEEFDGESGEGSDNLVRSDEDGATFACRSRAFEEQFDVLVSAERIVEIRRVEIKGCRPIELPADAGAIEDASNSGTSERSCQPSAKYYRTHQFLRFERHRAPSGSRKWLLFIGLILLSVEGLAI
jgi:hypothetical protein